VRSPSVVRKAGKAALLPAGALSRRRRGDLVILLYHRVAAGRGEGSLPVEVFERQLAHLAEHDRVVTLDAALQAGSEGGVVVTFDDGYADFYEHALPLLRRYEVPAVLYLATRLVEEDGGVTWSQLREAEGLVTVGAHTHAHVNLSRASAQRAEEELRRSKELIEDGLGAACRHFAYPWALASTAADQLVRRFFQSSARDLWSTNRRGRIDRYRLGRTPVLQSDGELFFRAKLAGLLDAEGLAYRALRRGPSR
jgi:peptidoglycan/xylan/chitin deacetylase (PgdA/CDA1 family)